MGEEWANLVSCTRRFSFQIRVACRTLFWEQPRCQNHSFAVLRIHTGRTDHCNLNDIKSLYLKQQNQV